MSKATLSRIERGERSPTLNELVALANALQISVSELTRLPVPAPANGHIDSTTKAIGLALDAIEVGHPGGVALPVAVLRDRVIQFHQHKWDALTWPAASANSARPIRWGLSSDRPTSGSATYTLDEAAAIALFDLLGEWLG